MIAYWYFVISMFMVSYKFWKGAQMSEVLTLLTSATGHPLVKSFSGPDVIQQPFSIGSLFDVSQEPVSVLSDE
jgi:hypothetical protein